jgi:hypothetical protein
MKTREKQQVNGIPRSIHPLWESQQPEESAKRAETWAPDSPCAGTTDRRWPRSDVQCAQSWTARFRCAQRQLEIDSKRQDEQKPTATVTNAEECEQNTVRLESSNLTSMRVNLHPSDAISVVIALQTYLLAALHWSMGVAKETHVRRRNERPRPLNLAHLRHA